MNGHVKWWDLRSGTGVILEEGMGLLVSFDRASIRSPHYSLRNEDWVSFEMVEEDGRYLARDVYYGFAWRSHGSS